MAQVPQAMAWVRQAMAWVLQAMAWVRRAMAWVLQAMAWVRQAMAQGRRAIPRKHWSIRDRGCDPGYARRAAPLAATPATVGAPGMPAVAQTGAPPTNTISAPSGTFTSGGVNSGGQLGASTIGSVVQALGGGAGTGPLSSDQMQALTGRLGAMNLNSNDMSAMGHALGLNDQQVSQIQQNIQASRQPAAPGLSPPPPPLYSPQQPAAPTGLGLPTGPVSMIEAKFQQLDNPLVTVTPPTSSNLTQFGYSAFMSPVSTFAPTQNVPITDDYMLGPGDQLVVFTGAGLTHSSSCRSRLTAVC